MRRPYRLLALVLTAGVLVLALAWLRDAEQRVPEGSRVSGELSAAAPSPSPAPALSDTRLQGALLRKGDLGRSWGRTKGAATWRDGLLKGRADRPECQELLDAVYAEDLLGEPSGAMAVAGFDDTEYGAQMRYQVGAYRREVVDAKLGHMGELAAHCGQFAATGAAGRRYDVRVAPVQLPGIGDARQALRMTVSGEVGGEEGALTLDVAALRVGDVAALLTYGGLGGIDDTTTREAAQQAAQRLQSVLSGKNPAEPSARPTRSDRTTGRPAGRE